MQVASCHITCWRGAHISCATMFIGRLSTVVRPPGKGGRQRKDREHELLNMTSPLYWLNEIKQTKANLPTLYQGLMWRDI